MSTQQLAARQMSDALLYGALRQADLFRHVLMAGADGGLCETLCFGPKVKVDQECGRRTVMTHQVAHQDTDDIWVNYYII